MRQVIVKNGQVDKALRQFKRKVIDSGVQRESRKHAYYLSPSDAKRELRRREKSKNRKENTANRGKSPSFKHPKF